ncbi:MAG TPA: sigma-E factor negative regulatory protein, partial [Telluria sp.]
MDTPKTIREQISAFSDHELSPSTLPDDALRSAEGEHAWHAYHRIGDIIREQDAPHLSAGFADKLAARLAAEPLPGKRLLRASAVALGRCA